MGNESSMPFTRHLENQFAASHDVGVAELPAGDGLAVQGYGFHVLVFLRQVLGDDGEGR